MATSMIMKHLSEIGIYSSNVTELRTALNAIGSGKTTTCAFSPSFISELTGEKITASFKGIITNLGGSADVFGMDGNGGIYVFRVNLPSDTEAAIVFIRRATTTAI